MSLNDNLAIHEEDAQRINGVLLHFLGESGAMEALLIGRHVQLLARGGASRSLDTGSLSALAAGAVSPAAAMAPPRAAAPPCLVVRLPSQYRSHRPARVSRTSP